MFCFDIWNHQVSISDVAWNNLISRIYLIMRFLDRIFEDLIDILLIIILLYAVVSVLDLFCFLGIILLTLMDYFFQLVIAFVTVKK